jgi:ABC-type nitrate/sulfonate/bicarbonate transport system substrate-binding protein
MKANYILISFTLFFTIISCSSEENIEAKEINDSAILNDSKDALDTIRVALDWSPNVLHAGIFYADHSGLLKENGIYLDWFTTEVDNYQKKPIQRLLDREVDLAVGPSEHLFFYGDTMDQNYAVAIATLLQKDQSAFVVKKRSGIASPKELNGKVYVGYKTPLEQEILSAMIKNDGGDGEFISITPPRLDAWDAFLNDKGHSAWVFSHWEGALAANEDVELNYFYPNKFGVPYGYSSVIMANKKRQRTQKQVIERFLIVMNIAHKELADKKASEVVEMLKEYSDHENFKNTEFVTKAWLNIKDAFLNEAGQWGKMSDEKWTNYYNWIIKNDALDFNKDIKDVGVYYEHLSILE